MDTTRSTLLCRVQDPGDEAAWREFDRLYRPVLAQFARRRGVLARDVEDVVQDCFDSIYKSLRSFEYDRSKGRFRSWLFTVVIHRVSRAVNKRGEQQADTRDFARPQERELSPEKLLELLELERFKEEALARVRGHVEAHTFDAFCLKVLDKVSAEQVAEKLGIAIEQVYVAVSRVRKKLRLEFEALLDESI